MGAIKERARSSAYGTPGKLLGWSQKWAGRSTPRVLARLAAAHPTQRTPAGALPRPLRPRRVADVTQARRRMYVRNVTDVGVHAREEDEAQHRARARAKQSSMPVTQKGGPSLRHRRPSTRAHEVAVKSKARHVGGAASRQSHRSSLLTRVLTDHARRADGTQRRLERQRAPRRIVAPPARATLRAQFSLGRLPASCAAPMARGKLREGGGGGGACGGGEQGTREEEGFSALFITLM